VHSALFEPDVSNNLATATTAIVNMMTLAPTSQSFTANGGYGSIHVSINVTPPASGCRYWILQKNVDWIPILYYEGVQDNGTVTYYVGGNPDSSRRIGTI